MLGLLLDSVSALLPMARGCAARTVQATVLVGRAHLVERLTTRLRHLQQVTATVRGTPNPDDERLGNLVHEVGEALQMSMAVPEIRWPPKDKPFDPPRLVD
jgi:hypothetical protein